MDYTEHKLLVKLSVLKKKAGETGSKKSERILKSEMKYKVKNKSFPSRYLSNGERQERRERATLVIAAAIKEGTLTKEMVIIDVNADDD